MPHERRGVAKLGGQIKKGREGEVTGQPGGPTNHGIGSVSVVVLNYNGRRFLKDCFESLFAQSFKNFEAIFVDNASHDDSVEFMRGRFARELTAGKLKIVVNERNEGFCEGNNIGVRAADPKSEYICLVNNDVILDGRWLEKLVDGIAANPNVGLIGTNAKNVGYEYQFEKMCTGRYTWTSGISGNTCMREVAPDEVFKNNVLWQMVAVGNGMLYRRGLVGEPFDKDYFAYSEDWLLSLITMIKGYDCAIALDARLTHLFSQTRRADRRLDRRLLYLGHRNLLMTFLIGFQPKTIAKLLPVLLLGQIGLVVFNPKYFFPLLRGWGWLAWNWRSVLAKRGKVQEHRRVGDEGIIRRMSYRLVDDSLPEFSAAHRLLVRTAGGLLYFYCKVFGIAVWEFQKHG